MEENIYEKAKEFLHRNWETHRQAFGPILEPAFEEDQQARLRLIAALNHISRRECEQGRQILTQELQMRCQNDSDRAAFRFFMGLSYDMENNRLQMMRWYLEAAKLNHRFSLPYIKLAKAFHQDGIYETAMHHYRIALSCLQEQQEPDDEVLGSVYVNMMSCLTMMHDFKAACHAWERAQQYPLQPAADASAAMLYAAMGDRQLRDHYLQRLEEKAPQLAEKTKAPTQQVLSGSHPHFSRVTTDPARIQAFWQWLTENEASFVRRDPEAFPQLSRQLHLLVPFMNRPPRFKLEKDKAGFFRVALCDSYSVGAHYVFGDLLKECPQQLRQKWTFTITH